MMHKLVTRFKPERSNTMKTLMILVFVLIIPFAAIAQNWTVEQQEVIDQINRNWISWAKAVDQKDFSVWKNEVQPLNDGYFWIGDSDTLMSGVAMETHFTGLMNNLKKFELEDRHYLAVKIYKDVAVVSYYVIVKIQFTDGVPVRIKQKNFEIFRKVANKWRWSDTMITSKTVD